jgi:hypothetical protein
MEALYTEEQTMIHDAARINAARLLIRHAARLRVDLTGVT